MDARRGPGTGASPRSALVPGVRRLPPPGSGGSLRGSGANSGPPALGAASDARRRPGIGAAPRSAFVPGVHRLPPPGSGGSPRGAGASSGRPTPGAVLGVDNRGCRPGSDPAAGGAPVPEVRRPLRVAPRCGTSLLGAGASARPRRRAALGAVRGDADHSVVAPQGNPRLGAAVPTEPPASPRVARSLGSFVVLASRDKSNSDRSAGARYELAVGGNVLRVSRQSYG